MSVSFKGPLADRYWGAVVLVLLALTPYLVLTTGLGPLQPVIGKSLGASSTTLEVGTGMANAAYAFGTVLALQLTVRLPVRRVLVVSSSLFIAGSVLAAWAPAPGFFFAGHVIQGLTTGLMLISAVPPLVIGWPKSTLPHTAAVMNLGVFGAVALGPVVGGVSAGQHSWRPLLWIVAGLGAAGLLFAFLTYEDQEPQDPEAPVDVVAVLLAATGCAAVFFGISVLLGHRLLSVVVLLPTLAGIALLVAFLVYEYVVDDPLIPIHRLLSTIPTSGIIIAMTAAGGSVALVQLAEMALQAKGASPTHTAMLFWPELGAALVAAVVFGRLFLTRFIPVLAFAGLVLLAGGAAILTGAARGSDALVAVGSGAVGLGVGFSVAPALFMSGLSLNSPEIPRVFAAVELLRGVAAFLMGPLLVHLATTTGSDPAVGLRTATWLAFGIVCGGGLLALAVFRSGRARLQVPDLERWLEGDGPALESPPLPTRRRPARV